MPLHYTNRHLNEKNLDPVRQLLKQYDSLNKETMDNAKKHKTKTKNSAYNNNIFCASVIGIKIIFC